MKRPSVKCTFEPDSLIVLLRYVPFTLLKFSSSLSVAVQESGAGNSNALRARAPLRGLGGLWPHCESVREGPGLGLGPGSSGGGSERATAGEMSVINSRLLRTAERS